MRGTESGPAVERARHPQPAIGGHRERSPVGIAEQWNRRRPRGADVDRAVEPVGAAAVGIVPGLIDVAAPLALSGVDREPLLVAAVGVDVGRPGGEVVERAVDGGRIVGRVVQARVENRSIGRRNEHRIGTEDAGAEDALRLPTAAAVERHVDAGLAEVAGDRIELPPADRDPSAVEPRHRERRLVGGIADDVETVSVDIHLHAHEGTEEGPSGGRFGRRKVRFRDRRLADVFMGHALLRGERGPRREAEQRTGDPHQDGRRSPSRHEQASKPGTRSHPITVSRVPPPLRSLQGLGDESFLQRWSWPRKVRLNPTCVQGSSIGNSGRPAPRGRNARGRSRHR